jgi:hypothetical protein
MVMSIAMFSELRTRSECVLVEPIHWCCSQIATSALLVWIGTFRSFVRLRTVGFVKCFGISAMNSNIHWCFFQIVMSGYYVQIFPHDFEVVILTAMFGE